MEVWKDIKGYEGLYQVSNFVRVKSLCRKVLSKKKNEPFLRIVNERILKMDIRNGYMYVSLSKNSISRKLMVHRLLAISFIDNPENKKFINHIDGDKLNNSLSNLEWCTSKENTNHAINIGLINRKGVKHHNSKLKEHEVYKIKFEHKNISLAQIGRIYNISRYVVWRIRNERSWKHVIKKSSNQS
jgi:hypothetical protein